MARRASLLLIVLLSALALGALVLLDRTPSAPEGAAGLTDARPELARPASALATANVQPVGLPDDAAAAPTAAPADRRAGIGARIEGRIAYAAGATPGGEVLVLAGPARASWQWEFAARRIGAGLSHDALVYGFAEADGAFALEWTGSDTQLAVVALAPTAATEAPVRWHSKEGSTLTLTLEPRAALFVDVKAGAGFGAGTAPEFRGAELRLRKTPNAEVDHDAARIPAARRNLTAWVDEQGRASFLAVSVDAEFELRYAENEAVPTAQPVPFLTKGEQRTVALELVAGATLLGRVVDESGIPVAGVNVRVVAPGTGDRRPRLVAASDTDGEGRLALKHVDGSARTLEFSKNGFLDGDHELPPGLADGATKDLGDLVLDHGARFAGHVRYPDGSPAVGRKCRPR
ncbi:MAG: hypothetical protein GC161_10090 [Planctomycetaceae bacterium]|nr:hypothetical protein [Planctomycetaceae bacterium]